MGAGSIKSRSPERPCPSCVVIPTVSCASLGGSVLFCRCLLPPMSNRVVASDDCRASGWTSGKSARDERSANAVRIGDIRPSAASDDMGRSPLGCVNLSPSVGRVIHATSIVN